MSNLPIGVFDSGLGGLTAVRELHHLMPNENIVYFGDTGRVPYGNRSRETIRKYSAQDMSFLLSHDVKMVIAACGTVSSVASDIGDTLGVPYTGVVYPAARAAVETTKSGRIGVIGTTATVSSHSYGKRINELMPEAVVIEKDCPLFVPFVENGFIDPNDELVKGIVARYLEFFTDKDIDTLILGCTHYPLLAEAIGNYIGKDIALINSGASVATKARRMLDERGLLNKSDEVGKVQFFVSDHIEGFKSVASIFLGGEFSGDVERIDIGAVRGVEY